MAERKLFKRKLKRKTTQAQDVAFPELENVLVRMDKLIDEGLANKKEFLKLEAWVLEFLQERGIDKYDRGPIGVTPVRPEGEDVDWTGIQKVLTAKKLWEKVLGEPQPVKQKLEALIELGLVKAEEIQPFVKVKPIKPSLRFNRRNV